MSNSTYIPYFIQRKRRLEKPLTESERRNLKKVFGALYCTQWLTRNEIAEITKLPWIEVDKALQRLHDIGNALKKGTPQKWRKIDR